MSGRSLFRSPAPSSQLPASRLGFSLVELLVATGIFIVISGMMLANFRRSSQAAVVARAAEGFAANVQRMQAAALSGSTNVANAIAFGVHIDAGASDHYTLFADRVVGTRPANGIYDSGEELADGRIPLSRNVQVKALEVTGTVDVLFAVPRATPQFSTAGTMVRLEFQHTSGARPRTVTVNRISGQVSVE